MILMDPRMGGKVEVKDRKIAAFISHITSSGIKCETEILSYGDFCFEGNGPKGKLSVGIEYKTLHGMLQDIDDSRYVQQRTGMAQMYDKSFLIVEGHWKPHEQGFLMEGFNSGTSWGFCKYRTSRVMYAKLYRYLLSVSMSGVVVIYSRDLQQTAYNICECFHYFQKPWDQHTALLDTRKLAIPTLNGRPSLVRLWASDITDVGVKISIEAERLFKTGFALANSDESAWMRLPRVGAKTAMQIIREIRGIK